MALKHLQVQRYKNDCVLACVATMTNKPIEELEKLFPFDLDSKDYIKGIAMEEMEWILNYNVVSWLKVDSKEYFKEINSVPEMPQPVIDRLNNSPLPTFTRLKEIVKVMSLPAILVMDTIDFGMVFHVVCYDQTEDLVYDLTTKETSDHPKSIDDPSIKVLGAYFLYGGAFYSGRLAGLLKGEQGG